MWPENDHTDLGAHATTDATAVDLTGQELEIVMASLLSDEAFAYNVPVFVEFAGPVDEEALLRAVRRTLSSCSVLRRSFRRHGRRLVAVPAPAPRVEHLHITSEEVAAVAARRRLRPLDGPLATAGVLHLDDTGRTMLFLNAHHAVVDGLSLSILLDAIAQDYLTGSRVDLDAHGRASQPGAARPGGTLRALPATQVSADQLRRFLGRIAALQAPGTGTAVVRQELPIPAHTGFASTLGAIVPALSVWADCVEVVLSTALAGRNVDNRRTIGNFVRLEPLVLDVRDWPYREPAALRAELTALGAGLAVRAQQGGGTGTQWAVRRAGGVGVVLDYGTQALVADRIHPGLDARVVEDSTYIDPKYPLHLSIDQTADTQRITFTARDIPRHRIERLAWLYAMQLQHGSLAGFTPPHRAVTPRSVTSHTVTSRPAHSVPA